MTDPKRRVEAAAIEAAQTYAAANGFAGDPVAIGLVLAGMVIGARCSERARGDLASGYAAQHPDADAVLWRWAERIDAAESAS